VATPARDLAASRRLAQSISPLSKETRVTRLDNGLRVASQEAFGQYSTVGVFVDAGSRYEVDHTSGVTHFLQKLAFQSSERFPSREALLQELDQYGGVYDCQRSRDVAIYSLSVFSFALSRALEILADCIWRPRITVEEVEQERQSIRFELETVKNGPSSEVWTTDLIHQAAYRENTLGLPSLCPEENISSVQREELLDYLSSHHRPERMVLAAVNVDHDQFVELARDRFGRPEPVWGERGGGRPVDHSISQYTGGAVKVERTGPPVVGPNPLPDLTHVVLACESSSYLHPDFYTFAVLNSLMGGGGSFSAGGPGKGMYTQLYRDVLTRHHWIYSALAQNHAYSDSGIFCLFGSADPSMARQLTEVLCTQFVAMTQTPEESAVRRAKMQLKSAMVMNLESRFILCEDIGRQVLGQNMKYTVEELMEKIDGVSSSDLQRVGEKMLECPVSLAAMGTLTHVPGKREVEAALHSQGGRLATKRRLFSFR
jgi:processing peptidase subunit alpha